MTCDVLIDKDNMAGYATSNMLNGSVIRLSEADIAAANKFAAFQNYDSMVASGYITEEQAAQLKAEYEQNAASPVNIEISMPDFSGVDMESLTFENTINFFMEQAQKAEVEQNEDGTTSIIIEVTGDDVVALYDAVFTDLKASASLVEAIDAYIASVEGNGKFTDLLDQVMAEIQKEKDVLQECEAEIVLTAEGELATATLYLSIKESVESDKVMEMTFGYTVEDALQIVGIEAVQGDEKVTLMFVAQCTEAEDVYVFSAESNDEEVIRVAVDWIKNHTETSINDEVTFMASIFNDGQEMSMTVTNETAAQFTAENVEMTEVTKIFLGQSAEELITINEHVYTTDAASCAETAKTLA